MLLEFRTSNYKSFADEMIFSLIPSSKDRTLSYSILKEKCGKKNYKALSSSIVYGPNASGKTNIVGAMDTLKAIIERGNIKDTASLATLNIASYQLYLVSNLNVHDRPTTFEIKFIDKGHIYDYFLSAYLGDFAKQDQPRRIDNEWLDIDGHRIFERSDSLVFGELENIQSYVNFENKEDFETLKNVAASNLNPDELFLCNGFKTIFAKDTFAKIQTWIKDQFIVIYHSDAVRSGTSARGADVNSMYVQKTITEAAKKFGVTSNFLAYRKTEQGVPELCSVLLDRKVFLPAEIFESFGTIRFIYEFPFVIRALQTGATLVMDEFDASIHPMAIMNIINIFHNDDINIHHAQLVFNTHNPIFLRRYLLRKDEIKFVERDSKTGNSIHYSLSDFGGTVPNDYMKHYFVDRFGAISNIDFGPLIQDILGIGEGHVDD